MTQRSETLVGTHLNSVWIEGTVVTPPIPVPVAQPAALRFRVRSPQTETREAPSEFLVEAVEGAYRGSGERLLPGRPVRIIGRLRQHEWRDPLGHLRNEVKIVGELIEPVGVTL